MKFFSMKKPAVRILLLVVLLGLAIFYFRYIREGFGEEGGTTDAAALPSDQIAALTTSGVAAMDAVTSTTKGTSCTTVGLTKTIKGTPMYCCKDQTGAIKWSDKSCPSEIVATLSTSQVRALTSS